MKPRLRVLFVDGCADTREVFGLGLRMQGLSVDLACDGIEAWDLAHARQPDVIVTDLILPRLDGLTLCRRLKQDCRTASIPVIALTGYLTPAEEVRRSGFAAYLLKPVAPDALAGRIRDTQARRLCA